MTTELPPNAEALRQLQANLLGSIDRTRAEITHLTGSNRELLGLIAFLMADALGPQEADRLVAAMSTTSLAAWTVQVRTAVLAKYA